MHGKVQYPFRSKQTLSAKQEFLAPPKYSPVIEDIMLYWLRTRFRNEVVTT